VGHTDYFDDTGAIQNMVSRGMKTTQEDNIVLFNLAPCTEYIITITGQNTISTVTSKPLKLQTSAIGKYCLPIAVVITICYVLATVLEAAATPSIATQMRSDGHSHPMVTIDPVSDNIGCKK